MPIGNGFEFFVRVREYKWKYLHILTRHTHTQIVETNALDARIRDTEIEKRTDEERCGGDWMGRAQLESVRQFRFRLLNTDRDGTIIQVVVVHKIESTANFSFFFPAQQQFMHSMMSHCLPHNSAETRFLSLAVHANRLTLSWTRISTPTEIHATQQARKKIIEQYIYIYKFVVVVAKIMALYYIVFEMRRFRITLRYELLAEMAFMYLKRAHTHKFSPL